jgi:ComF family protein
MSLLRVKSNGLGWAKIFSDFNSLFFPEFCLGCSSSLVQGEDILCTGCILDMPRTGYHLADSNPVAEKFIGRLPVKHAWAFLKFRKTGMVQHLLHQLKYNNQPEVGIRLGKLFGRELNDSGKNEFDLIIPVPLHPARLRTRGYNQSAKFSEGLGASLNVPFSEGISVRRNNTQTQTKKNKTERWDNVSQAFDIKDGEVIKGKRVLLVDDIITTGATLEACGQQLLESGCKELSIACIAEAQ